MKKQKLLDLAREVECALDDVEIIRRCGRYVLVRVASATGGETRLVSREQLENMLDASWAEGGERDEKTPFVSGV